MRTTSKEMKYRGWKEPPHDLNEKGLQRWQFVHLLGSTEVTSVPISVFNAC